MKTFLKKKAIYDVPMNQLIIGFLSFGLTFNFIIQFLINPQFIFLIHEIMRLIVVVTLGISYVLTAVSFLTESDGKKRVKHLFAMYALALIPYAFYAFIFIGQTPQFYL